jgi:hypothetical protein
MGDEVQDDQTRDESQSPIESSLVLYVPLSAVTENSAAFCQPVLPRPVASCALQRVGMLVQYIAEYAPDVKRYGGLFECLTSSLASRTIVAD